jgi:hypothetical protein
VERLDEKRQDERELWNWGEKERVVEKAAVVVEKVVMAEKEE